MTISAATIRKLVDAGLAGDVLVSVVEIIETDSETRRAKARDKKRRQREMSRGQSGTDRDMEGTNGDTVSPKEIPPTPPKEITPSLSSEANASSDSKRTATAELATVIDQERAEAVVAHRKALRKPLTQRAAQLMAASLAACPDPAAAADTMIEKGWLTAKPEWMANATGPPGRRSQNGAAAAAITLIGEYLDGQPYDPFAAPSPGNAGTADADAASFAGSPHQRGDDLGWPDGAASGQGDQRRRTPGHGGPVIDLEAVPRRA